MAGKFEVKNTSAGKVMFNLLAGNGQVVLTSQSYASKQSALDGVASVKTNAASGDRFERRTAKDGSPYFVLLAGNQQEIGRSEMYSAAAAMENGIASVKKNAPDATIADDA